MRYKNILDTIGNTPMVLIKKLNPNQKVRILAKLERVNPGGSVKDRVAKFLIEDAERRGVLVKNKTIVEATSGNTGIGLAMIAAIRGYKFTAVMPESVSIERVKLLRAYGANIIFSNRNEGTNGSIKLVEKLVKENKNYLLLDQFNNSANVLAHYETTGQEIVEEVDTIDIFVAGMGTGGTLMGVSKKIREFFPNVKIVGIEPLERENVSGLRNMKVYKPSIYDEEKLDLKLNITNKDATEMARHLFTEEGISAGMSSGAAMYGALTMAEKMDRGVIVTLFPDGGEKYLSTEMFTLG